MSPRRNRRASFHGVESTLEKEGQRSEVRADTVYKSICKLKGGPYMKIFDESDIPAVGSTPCLRPFPSLLQDKEGCRQSTGRCHTRFMVRDDSRDSETKGNV